VQLKMAVHCVQICGNNDNENLIRNQIYNKGMEPIAFIKYSYYTLQKTGHMLVPLQFTGY